MFVALKFLNFKQYKHQTLKWALKTKILKIIQAT